MPKTIVAKLVWDTTDISHDGRIINFAAGLDGEVLLLTVKRCPCDPDGTSHLNKSWRPSKEHKHEFVIFSRSATGEGIESSIKPSSVWYHFVQPLDKGRWLLVPPSTERDHEEKAHVISSHGRRLHAFYMSSSIQDIQTSEEQIWVSYSVKDTAGTDEVNSTVLAGFDWRGAITFSFDYERQRANKPLPPALNQAIINCVARGDVWLCYNWYKTGWLGSSEERAIVRITNGKIREHWLQLPQAARGEAFCVKDHSVLFCRSDSSSNIPVDAQTQMILLNLDSMQTNSYVLVAEDGTPLKPARIVGRASSLYCLAGNCIYEVNINEF